MTVKEFLKDKQNRKRFEGNLEGLGNDREIEYWENLEDYEQTLKDNDWDDEDIAEQMDYIRCTKYEPKDGGEDFIIVID